jgi:hypothetical protein
VDVLINVSEYVYWPICASSQPQSIIRRQDTRPET